MSRYSCCLHCEHGTEEDVRHGEPCTAPGCDGTLLLTWQEEREQVIADLGASPADVAAALRVLGDDAEAWTCPVSVGSAMTGAEYALRRHMRRLAVTS